MSRVFEKQYAKFISSNLLPSFPIPSKNQVNVNLLLKMQN